MTIPNDELMPCLKLFSETKVRYRIDSQILSARPVSPYTRPVQSKAIVSLTAEPRLFDGYINGYRQPSVLIAIRVRAVDVMQMQHLSEALAHYFTKYTASINKIHSLFDITVSFGEGLRALQRAGGSLVFEAVKINQSKTSDHEFTILAPALFDITLNQVMTFLLNFFNHHLSAEPFVQSEMIAGQLCRLLVKLKKHELLHRGVDRPE